MGSVSEVGKKIFGEQINEIGKYTVEKEKPDLRLALPRGRVFNVYVIIEALSELVIRHEGETDLTVISLDGLEVPAILNTKVQAVERRTMLKLLHKFYDNNKEYVLNLVKDYNEYRISRGKDAETFNGTIQSNEYRKKLEEGLEAAIGAYNCAVRPYERRGGEEKVAGYCRLCPNCLIYGYAVEEGLDYNVKSRVEGDLYLATLPTSKCVTTRTFNAVDDVKKTTERALYKLRVVEPGTLFVGKIAVRDVSLAELLLVLLSISKIDRTGGRVTHFGRVRTHIPAIVVSDSERGSGYDLARKIFGKYKEGTGDLENTRNTVAEYVSTVGGIPILIRDIASNLRSLSDSEVNAIIEQAWNDVIVYRESLDLYVSSGGVK